MEKKRARSLSPLIDKHRDFLSVFEDGEPPKPTPIEKPQEKKERVKREKLASHIA